jgi:hypothetical protein
MALVYRAIWREDAGGAIDRGFAEFANWLESKHQFMPPQVGSAGKPDGSKVDVIVTRAESDGVKGLRCVLHEDTDDERWTTTLTVLESPNLRPSFWVDLEVVSVDAFAAPQAQPPRLVTELLRSARNPQSGAVPIGIEYGVWDSETAQMAADFILDPGRDMPVVVVAPGEDDLPDAAGRARSTIRKLTGVASVGLLEPAAVTTVGEAVGPDLAVEPGAVRVFLPGAGSDDAAWRHFVVPPTVAARSWATAGRVIAERLAISIAARRAPAEYETVRRLLAAGVVRRSDEELEQLWDEAVMEAERLRSRAQHAEEEKALAVMALEDAEKENEHLRGTVAFFALQLQGERALTPELAGDGLPDTAQDPSDAIRLAREHLDRVVIPDGAIATVGELDTTLQASVWGRKTWQALRALHLYAIDRSRQGGFWEWCQHSGHPFAWPATERTLAMSDSDTAMREFADDRRFPIDPRVRGERTQVMDAHIKVAQAGGSLTPRIYFYDDTGGVTGKVHVGFVGPHRYVRNAGSR